MYSSTTYMPEPPGARVAAISRDPEGTKELTVARNIRKAAVGISAGGGGNDENVPVRSTKSWAEDVGAAVGFAEVVFCPATLVRDFATG